MPYNTKAMNNNPTRISMGTHHFPFLLLDSEHDLSYNFLSLVGVL